MNESTFPGHAQAQAWLQRGTKNLYIDGKWGPALSGKTFTSADPATERPLADIAEMAPAIEASRALVYKAAYCMDNNLPSNRLAAIAKYHASVTAKLCADKAQQIFGCYGLAREYRVSWMKAYADVFFNGEGSANIQRILIAEDALGYKIADRHHGKTGLRNVRADKVATVSPDASL